MFNYKSYKSDAERSLSAMMWMDRVRWALVLAVVIFHFPTVEHVDASNDCPSDWHHFKGNCYKYFSEAKNFNDSDEHCKELNSRVTSILSQDEYDKVREVGKEASGQFYIGLVYSLDKKTNAKDRKNWEWIDGTEYVYQQTYHAWGDNEPNLLDELCVINNNGEWHDFPCDWKRPFVCKKRIEPSTTVKVASTTTKEPSTVKVVEVSPSTKGPGTNVAAIGEPMIFLIVVIGAGAVFAAPMLPGAEMAF